MPIEAVEGVGVSAKGEPPDATVNHRSVFPEVAPAVRGVAVVF